MYLLEDDLFGNPTLTYIDENGSKWFIPLDEANTDYQQYLLWLEEQA